MNKIPFALGRASGVAASEPEYNQEVKYIRGQAVFAGLVVARRGKPFSVITVDADNWQRKLGTPAHPREGRQFESLRHVAQAVNGGSGKVVRVVGRDMRVPLLRLTVNDTPAPVTTGKVNLAVSTFSVSKKVLLADGKDEITVQLVAKDKNNNLLLNQSTIVFKSLGRTQPTISQTYEINGTYYATLTANKSDRLLLIVLEGNERIGTFEEYVDVRPAIIDPDKSIFTATPDILDGDGSQQATLLLKAIDPDGLEISGLNNIEFVVTGNANPLMTNILEVMPGVYQAKVSASNQGTMVVTVRQNGVLMAPLQLSIRLVKVVHGGMTFENASTFDVIPREIYADGNDTSNLIFTVADKNGARIKGIANQLSFKVEGITQFTLSAITEQRSGLYEATLQSTDKGQATITPVQYYNGRDVELKKLAVDIEAIETPRVDAALTTLTKDKSRIINNGTDCVAYTLRLNDAQNKPISHLHGLSVVVTSGAGTISQLNESKPGVITFTVTSTYYGDVEVSLMQYGAPLGTITDRFVSAPVSALTPTNSTLVVKAMQTDGVAQVMIEQPEVSALAVIPPAAPAVKTWVHVNFAAVEPFSEVTDEGNPITLADDDLMVIYPDDGEASTNRSVEIMPDVEPGKWLLVLNETDNMGIDTMLERWSFSLDPQGRDAFGLPDWLPLKLEAKNSRLRAIVQPGVPFPDTFTGIESTRFVGGTDGDNNALTVADYRRALNALSASMDTYNVMLSLGCYEGAVIEDLAQHAWDRRIDMFADVPCEYSPQQAFNFMRSLSLGNFPNVAMYHFPYSSRDPFTRIPVVYGLSGDVFYAKARGVLQVRGCGGWHFAPAGMARATIRRQSIVPLHENADEIDREAYVMARLNPVASGVTGALQIDDSLTTWGQNNDLQYQNITSVMNSITRDLYEICRVIKHDPSNVPGVALRREIPLLLNEYVNAGALVAPTDPTSTPLPYLYEVAEDGFDAWKISVAVCIVGTARRIQCEPIIYR